MNTRNKMVIFCMNNVFCVLLSFLAACIQTSVSACYSDGIYTFGFECEYMCHCAGGGACDARTGHCINGCEKKWFGPGCQFRDLAEGELSRHLDNMQPHHYAPEANDGDINSCSYTNNATASRGKNPWWRVYFPQTETIWSMEIVTIEAALSYFQGFNVMVENIPASKRDDSTYYPAEQQLCYEHSNSGPSSTTIHVSCINPLKGNQVRIQLARKDTQLVLCDVKINGGRNMAFKKNVTSNVVEDSDPVSKVVDGIVVNNNWKYCFIIPVDPKADWIIVDLAQQTFVSSVKIVSFNRYELYNKYRLYVSDFYEWPYNTIIHDDTQNLIPTQYLSLNVTGQYIYFDRNSPDRAVICEIEVYGDCLPGHCGYDCSKECNCKAIGDRVTGDCRSGCQGRWVGRDGHCLTKCEDFEWGSDCTRHCGKCINSEPCDVETGFCPNGCAAGYINDPMCAQACLIGTYGENCKEKCNGNCAAGKACRNTDGYCVDGCSPGYTGDKCDSECPPPLYGANCSMACSTHCEGGDVNCHHVNGTCLQGCKSGWEGDVCDKECQAGFWYKNCKQRCGSCLNGTCDKTTGVCNSGCAAGFKNTQRCLTECDDFYFGINCESICYNCKAVCDKSDGSCSSCRAGWKGTHCTEECPSNEWGDNCERSCGECLSGTCDRVTGTCSGGCKRGYKYTPMCTEACPIGTYGSSCTNTCSANCKTPFECHNVDGHCKSCKAGKKGAFCDEDCVSGRYGENCLQSCGSCDRNETCNIESGYCNKGCSKGYKHTQLCNEGCDDGTHGYNCSNVCGKCKPGTSCDKTTGICHAGCVDGFKPGMCQEALPLNDSFPVGGVVGGVIASVTVIMVVVVVLILIRRRKKHNEFGQSKTSKLTEHGDVLQADLKHEQTQKKESHKRENVYMNSDVLQTELKHSRELDAEHQQMTREMSSVSEQLEDDNNGVYYNEEPLSRHKTEHSVCVMDLQAYVKKKRSGNNGFKKEFEKLPSGLQHPTTVAKRVENIGKNRYKALYAYDHSRVVLKCLPGAPGSDYINASYIKGYKKDNAYIASQGPVVNNIDDFWRMIWEKDVHTIVMATRIEEETKMKCKQYWAEVGDIVQYGSISVQTESEDVKAEFQIRRLKVLKEDEPGTVRHITHFHYMAWPDKDVPKSTSSLLNFWYQVRKSDEMKSHTWLVHCSAGVGRTGTFIAIDFLYDQGTDQGWIDVFQCVHDLRDQRVCMVQTKEQYRYLHSVLVEAFLLPWKPIHVDNIPMLYRQLLEIDKKTGKTNILLEYESSLAEIDNGSLSDQNDDMYTSAKHIDNRSKNRYNNILAPDVYRPYLFTHVQGCTNYINAIYMPSYSDIFGYILTQTPLLNTAIDCCRLVFEQEFSVIITFEEDVGSDEEKGIYLPENGEMQIGPFTVALASTEEKSHTTLKRYRLEFESKEHRFTELVCKQWPSEELAPMNPSVILTFLQDLEKLQMEAGRKPVLAQCLNGAERSGLIVVLMNILERMRLTNEVSVPQVIRQMRIRRQQIIPNYEQYRFCYEVLQSYVENNTVYANV